MARRKPVQEAAADSRRSVSRMAAIFDDKAAPKASTYIQPIQAVPTCFPYFDYITGVGGLPVGRVVVVHGPSNEGKTEFCLGLLKSYLDLGHAAAYADAEHTTPVEFARSRIGDSYDSDAFRAIPIGPYEKFRVDVRRFCETVANAREKGLIDSESTALVVVDSLKNLIPEDALDLMARTASDKGVKGKTGKKIGMDGKGGRLGQIQAQYNTAWFVELSSLLYETKTTVVAITRERVEEGEGFFADDKYELVGGREVRYGTSLQLRVSRQSMYDDEKRFIGERHRVEIHKTKLSKRAEVYPAGYFHTSNGALSPEGFDRALDVFELGVELGVIEQAGAWYSFAGGKLGQGQAKSLEKMRDDAELRGAIELECRAKFGLQKAVP